MAKFRIICLDNDMNMLPLWSEEDGTLEYECVGDTDMISLRVPRGTHEVIVSDLDLVKRED